MIEIARFENHVGTAVLSIEGVKGPNPALVLDYTVGSGVTERKYDGDSLENALYAMHVYTRCLSGAARPVTQGI
jgi:hypothetical protein